MKTKINSFRAVGTSCRTYTIELWEYRIYNRDESVGAVIEAMTSDGKKVESVANGQFQIVTTGEILTFADPAGETKKRSKGPTPSVAGLPW